jgi:hypothetical protein
MKKLLVISLVCIITGCASVQDKVENIFSAGYDNNEYGLVNKVRTIAQTAKTCDTSTVNDLYFVTTELKNYSQYIPRNKQSIALNQDLYTIVSELYNKEQPIGAFYCKSKLNIVEKTAERIQQVTGSKSR